MKTYLQFINENISNKTINMSDKLIKRLSSINNKFSNCLLSLTKKVNGTELKTRYADFLDYEDNGTISYLYNDISSVDPYNDKDKRMTIKITRLLNKIVINKNGFLDFYNILQTDIETFINKWNSLLDSIIKIEEWNGKKIIDAFNYKNNIDQTKFSVSCANFNCSNGYEDPKIDWFDVYVENPKQIKAIVAIEGEKLLGRRILIEGKQFIDGYFKKDVFYSIINPYYGEGGQKSKIDQMIINHVLKTRKNVYINNYGNLYDIKNNINLSNNEMDFVIQLNKTDFNKYPPFDNVFINNENRLLSFKKINGYVWKKAYKAGHDGYEHV